MRNDGIYLSHPYMIHSPEEGLDMRGEIDES